MLVRKIDILSWSAGLFMIAFVLFSTKFGIEIVLTLFSELLKF